MKAKSFQKNLAKNFVLASTIPLILVIIISYINQLNTIKKEVLVDNKLYANILKAQLESILHEPVAKLEQLKNHILAHKHDDNQLEVLMSYTIDNYPLFETIYIANTEGIIQHISSTPDLKHIKDEYIGFDISRFVSLSDIKKNKTGLWSDMFISPLSGKASLSLMIYANDFIVCGNLSIEQLQNLAGTTKIANKDFYTYLLDNNDTLIAGPEKEQALQLSNMQDILKNSMLRDPHSVTHQLIIDNHKYLGSIITISQTNWKFIVAQDKKQAFASLNILRYIYLIVLILIMPVMLIWSGFLWKKVFLPLSTLKFGIKKITNGDYNIPYPKNNYREFNNISNSFNTMRDKLKDRENSLLTNEARFRLLYDKSPLPYQSLNINGQIIEANEAWLKLLKYPKDQVIGKWFGDFLTPKSQDIFKHNFPKFKAIGEINNVNFTMLTSKDEEIYTEANGKVAYDEKGNFKQSHCILRDITEQSKVEAQLRESEHLHRLLIENQHDLIVRFSPDLKFLYISPNYCNTFNIKKSNLLGNYFADHIDKDDRLNIIKSVKSALNPPYHSKYEEIITTSKGTKWISWITRAVLSNSGKIDSLICIGRDVTSIKQNEIQQAFIIKLFKIINTSNNKLDFLHEIIIALKDYTGMDAIGIRLIEGNNYPYYSTYGFSDEFIKSENNLLETDNNKCIRMDSNGKPYLACLCGKVLNGEIDTFLPNCTLNKSFFINSTTDNIDENIRKLLRGRCNSEGYESVALIPLCSDGKTLGLIQFNKIERNAFTKEQILFYETIANSISIGISRVFAETALTESEHRFRSLFSNMPSGVAVYKVRDNGTNFIFDDVNEQALKSINNSKENLIGKNIIEVIPDVDKMPELLECFTRVWKTGKSEHLPPIPFKGNDNTLWYENHVYRLNSGEIIAVFHDVTSRKEAEMELQTHKNKLQEYIIKLTEAEENERKRIATELHDRVSQSLVFTKLKVDELLNDNGSITDFELISTNLDNIINDAQNLTYDMGSMTLYELGLVPAINEWVENEMLPRDIKVTINAVKNLNSLDIKNNLLALAFRNTKELLINIIKHANANNVSIDIAVDNQIMTIKVKDDGNGLDKSSLTSQNDGLGYGLFSIREKLFGIGGSMQIESKKKKGTEITLNIPISIKER